MSIFTVCSSLECWNIVDHAYRAWSIDSIADALLPDTEIALLELVEFFIFAFELTCEQQMLRLFVYMVQIMIFICEVLELDLVQAEGRQSTQRWTLLYLIYVHEVACASSVSLRR